MTRTEGSSVRIRSHHSTQLRVIYNRVSRLVEELHGFQVALIECTAGGEFQIPRPSGDAPELLPGCIAHQSKARSFDSRIPHATRHP